MSAERVEIGAVKGRHVFACWDKDSIWVEIAGPKGGNAWRMAPFLARDLAQTLGRAVDRVYAEDRAS